MRFTSEWNKHAVRTYKANWYCDPQQHRFNEDIRDITLSQRSDVSDEEAARHIRESIPQHDVLLAGFPCQPFSLPASLRKMRWAVRMALPAKPRERCFLTW